MSVTARLYDRARAALDERGFDADAQTKIALFVGAAKTINATMLAAGELAPAVTVAYPFLHGQYYRELEFASLLARITRWSPNPFVYAEGATLVAPLWSEWWSIQVAAGTSFDAGASYKALALGHALLSRVRLAPVIGARADDLDPFVVAIRRIEQDSGRMIQAQIRLLKGGEIPLGLEERERIIEAEQAIVDDAFTRFLAWLANDAAAPPAAQPASVVSISDGRTLR